MNSKQNSSNSRQVRWVLIGSLSAFLFSLISSAILSRYLDKYDYGTYKQLLYVYNSLLIVFTLGLSKTYSYFLPRIDISEAKNTIKKIHSLLMISGISMSIFLFIGAEAISNALNNTALTQLIRYFCLVPTFLLPTIGLEGILATYKNTKLLAVYNISTKILMLLFVVTPVLFFGGGVESAVIGFSIASLFSFFIAEYLRYYPLREIKHHKNSIITYKDLFGYAMPLLYASLWGVIIVSADQFFISRYFGSEEFAEFANGSLQLPFVTMIISATSIVLASIYSKKAFENTKTSKQEIIRIWQSVFSKTIKPTYPLVLFFMVFVTPIMVMLYGSEYIKSGDYFQVKLLVIFFTLITYGLLLLSIGGQIFYYRIHMYAAIGLVLAEYLSIKYINSPMAIVWISVLFEIGKILAMLSYISKYFDLKIYELIP